MFFHCQCIAFYFIFQKICICCILCIKHNTGGSELDDGGDNVEEEDELADSSGEDGGEEDEEELDKVASRPREMQKLFDAEVCGFRLAGLSHSWVGFSLIC